MKTDLLNGAPGRLTGQRPADDAWPSYGRGFLTGERHPEIGLSGNGCTTYYYDGAWNIHQIGNAQFRYALKFTGHERDRNGGGKGQLDYMHARSCSPVTGRFLSVDPVLVAGRAVRMPQSWNRYAAVANNPVKYVDPAGKVFRLAGCVTDRDSHPGGNTTISHKTSSSDRTYPCSRPIESSTLMKFLVRSAYAYCLTQFYWTYVVMEHSPLLDVWGLVSLLKFLGLPVVLGRLILPDWAGSLLASIFTPLLVPFFHIKLCQILPIGMVSYLAFFYFPWALRALVGRLNKEAGRNSDGASWFLRLLEGLNEKWSRICSRISPTVVSTFNRILLAYLLASGIPILANYHGTETLAAIASGAAMLLDFPVAAVGLLLPESARGLDYFFGSPPATLHSGRQLAIHSLVGTLIYFSILQLFSFWRNRIQARSNQIRTSVPDPES